jgi:hypothetical protein
MDYPTQLKTELSNQSDRLDIMSKRVDALLAKVDLMHLETKEIIKQTEHLKGRIRKNKRYV